MDNNKLKNPAYLFEVSWEVCNKVGGIHTVISTKALNMEKEYSSSHSRTVECGWKTDCHPG